MVVAAQPPNRWWLSREMRLCAMGLMVGLCAVLLIQAFLMAYRDIGCDFTSYLLAARALRDGSNPYEVRMPFPYLYPPPVAFALVPLTFVPYWLASAVGSPLASAVWWQAACCWNGPAWRAADRRRSGNWQCPAS